MKLEGLFEKIRREQVAIFVGSGMSLSAGYPSATQLKSALGTEYLKFSEDYSEEELNTFELDDVSEKLERIAGRNCLNQILLNTFKKPPTDTFTHDRLSRIPHFKEIITTNYDKLLENSFINRANVVRVEQDLAYCINKRNPTIYKIHGDIDSLDTVIITKSDYARSIYKQSENLVWNKIKNIAASSDLLFIGYSYEDSNLWQIFDHLKRAQGNHSRQRFLISPSFKEAHKNHLIQQGFNCYEMTGESFIEQLSDNIKENIIGDLQSKQVSHDTFNTFLEFHEKSSIIKSDADKTVVEAILNKDGRIDNKITFTVPEEIAQKILDFSAGKIETKELDITNLIDFSYSAGGFKFPSTATDIRQLKIQTIPTKKKVSIELVGIESGLQDIDAFLYNFATKNVLELDTPCIKLSFNFKNDYVDQLEGGLEYEFKDILPNTSVALKELEFLELMLNKKKEFKFFIDNNKPFKGRLNKTRRIDPILRNLYRHIQHLRNIERFYDIKFSNIPLDSITEQHITNGNFLNELITKGKFIEVDKNKRVRIARDLPQGAAQNFFKGDLHKNSSIFLTEDTLIRTIYEHTIDFGHLLLEFINPTKDQIDNVNYIRSTTGETIYRLITEEDFKRFKNTLPEGYRSP